MSLRTEVASLRKALQDSAGSVRMDTHVSSVSGELDDVNDDISEDGGGRQYDGPAPSKTLRPFCKCLFQD